MEYDSDLVTFTLMCKCMSIIKYSVEYYSSMVKFDMIMNSKNLVIYVFDVMNVGILV